MLVPRVGVSPNPRWNMTFIIRRWIITSLMAAADAAEPARGSRRRREEEASCSMQH